SECVVDHRRQAEARAKKTNPDGTGGERGPTCNTGTNYRAQPTEADPRPSCSSHQFADLSDAVLQTTHSFLNNQCAVSIVLDQRPIRNVTLDFTPEVTQLVPVPGLKLRQPCRFDFIQRRRQQPAKHEFTNRRTAALTGSLI